MELDADIPLASEEILLKYETASKIANNVLTEVAAAATPGKLIVELCELGDQTILNSIAEVYPEVKEKGIAFPTCISVNNIVGHFSPYADDKTTLKKGDLVKIDLGVHIDGYISQCAHSIVLNEDPESPVSGRIADVICATHFAAEVCHRLIKPGNTNTQVSEALKKVADIFKCNMVEGVLTHEIKRYIMDGNKVILNRRDVDHQANEITFETYEAYVVDIVVSTGTGKVKEGEIKKTVFKRALDQTYNVKLQASRRLLSEATRKNQSMGFTLRNFDPKIARLGITEILKYNLFQAFPVLEERPDQFVSQAKFTLLLLPQGQIRLNEFAEPFVSSEYSVDSDCDISSILAMPV